MSILISLGGCAFLIPDNPSAPRYKPELGGRRVPSLNPQGGSSQTPADESMAAPAPSISSVDVPPPSNPAFPPVDAATKAQADAVLNASGNAPLAEQARRAPVENQGTELAANAPSLNSVPLRPVMTGPDSAEEQLIKVRAQLERDRNAAGSAASNLAADAAAEPSLLKSNDLAPLPSSQPVSPPPAPIPMPVPASRIVPGAPNAPTSMAIPPTRTSNAEFIAPPPLMPPPPTPLTGGARNAPMPMATNDVSMPPVVASVPPPNNAMSGLEPIMLRPLVNMPPQQRAAAPVRFAQPVELAPSSLPRASGGFDPMASGALSSQRTATASANDSGYLPPSRYTR